MNLQYKGASLQNLKIEAVELSSFCKWVEDIYNVECHLPAVLGNMLIVCLEALAKELACTVLISVKSCKTGTTPDAFTFPPTHAKVW